MPPEPYGNQGNATIGRFLDGPGRLLGAHLRLVPTRANGQPAFGCYRQDPQAAIVRSYGLMVLTLEGDRISAITWFGDRGLFPTSGCHARSTNGSTVPMDHATADRDLEQGWRLQSSDEAGGLSAKLGHPA
jgi:hypothetical protein